MPTTCRSWGAVWGLSSGHLLYPQLLLNTLRPGEARDLLGATQRSRLSRTCSPSCFLIVASCPFSPGTLLSSLAHGLHPARCLVHSLMQERRRPSPESQSLIFYHTTPLTASFPVSSVSFIHSHIIRVFVPAAVCWGPCRVLGRRDETSPVLKDPTA